MGFVHFVLTHFYVPRLPSPTFMSIATLIDGFHEKNKNNNNNNNNNYYYYI